MQINACVYVDCNSRVRGNSQRVLTTNDTKDTKDSQRRFFLKRKRGASELCVLSVLRGESKPESACRSRLCATPGPNRLCGALSVHHLRHELVIVAEVDEVGGDGVAGLQSFEIGEGRAHDVDVDAGEECGGGVVDAALPCVEVDQPLDRFG